MKNVPPNPPPISVLVPAFNEERWIAATIESVRQSFSAVGAPDYELIVCDNNSTDRTAELAQAGGARVVFEPHNQIARARNAAANAARGRWLIFLDADTLLNPHTLQATLRSIESNRIGAGGAVLRLDEPNLPARIRVIVNGWNRVSRWLNLAAGSYLFCRRDAWQAVGGFDERYYASEELWFSKKLKRWCRAHGLKFQILSTAPIVTSARKLKWFTPWQMYKQFLVLLVPGAWCKRENCSTWYQRPQMKGEIAGEP